MEMIERENFFMFKMRTSIEMKDSLFLFINSSEEQIVWVQMKNIIGA